MAAFSQEQATVTLINAGRRQRALRNVWGKPKHLEFIYQ